MGNERPVVAVSERNLISYIRVSPGKGKIRLDVEVQRTSVSRFTNAEGFNVVAEYVEICKGSASFKDRTILATALMDARARRCPIIVAKLDRLSRDAAFITYLMGRSVPVVVAELGGDAGPFTLNPYAGLKAYRAASVAALVRRMPGGLSPEAARMMVLRGEGLTYRAIADTLNAEGLLAPAGGPWQAGNVHRALARLAPFADQAI